MTRLAGAISGQFGVQMYESGADTKPATGNVVGHVRVLSSVRSPQLGNVRDVYVYLPPSYKGSARHYPVIYMHDGQNLFDASLSFAGEWGVDETMERLAPLGYEAIVVAIPNMGGERSDEYSPWRDRRAGGGRGNEYLSFIIDTLKPRIDRRFRTRREREHTGIAGSSMGGLISLYGFLRHPGVFGFCGAMSPSLWFAGGAIFATAAGIERWFGRIYLDIGTEEGRRHVRDTQRMYRLLRWKCPYPRDQLLHVVDEGAHHNEHAWAGRFEHAIKFLLPRRKADLTW
jgi:predicted alpha/beta superfamily hydrolase